MIAIKTEEIVPLTQYVYSLSGISLDEKKAYLFESRFGPLLDDLGLKSYSELLTKARADMSRKLEQRIIDAITTNETLFFRDSSPFEVLQHKILPDLIDSRTARASGNLPIRFKIWSAACSTGQEVYSIAIILKELLGPNSRYSVSLLGTDLSDAAVAQASYGQYNRFEIERGLPGDKLGRYFESNGASWKIRDEIRAMASFRKLNLMQPFNHLGRFDIIFCRNVAIYFTVEDRKRLFDRLADMLEPDGCLIIGSTESLTGICERFEAKRHIRSIYYQLKK